MTSIHPPRRTYGYDYSGRNLAAIQGKRIPDCPTSRPDWLCVVRGIRTHDGFAQELYGHLPEITRALNARAIMSNRVPDMKSPDDFPYCFWHPDIPAEQTLRDLLERYPGNDLLRYQVGRACAAGGYTSLYLELDLLPDVAIAEEARDNRASGQEIYQNIINSPTRWACMDDYNRCLHSPLRSGAHLNGDTCVRSMLDQTLPVGNAIFLTVPAPTFDITEDWCLDAEGTLPGARPVDPEAVRLLCEPLPADLPTVDKDLLILMAAWSGNIDRYTRLRRPTMLHGELPCVVRGIYHHPFFAKWWLMQDTDSEPIRQAVYARFILNNDLSWLNDNTPDTDLPVLIWFPKAADKNTYTELARLRPSMTPQIARACINANYQELFDSLNAKPDIFLWRAAEESPNSHYLEQIQEKARELGLDRYELSTLDEPIEEFASMWPFRPDVTDTWPMAMLANEMKSTASLGLTVVREITIDQVGFEPEGDVLPSVAEMILLNACLADPSIRPSPPFERLDLREVYRDAPYVESEENRKLVGLWPNPRRPRGGYRGRGHGKG
ncbi:uncharacterized protein N7479_003173 [Penicillium vulpinum]|uniref:Uncharacterized protein n=1 Tax=Penicillium vulpinum TaxID=29845 RepID=A0A1V6S403_9EURO|nr:uncharacterized protein N7479_003173 [Penicillium vulpinum]KAJ5963297.1 hypothetical protein N7479_003173 [Penicillium vulpinum]OQE08460.1 hypothetical protein PENVUL_c009G05001 [Penicillium vulpinum]